MRNASAASRKTAAFSGESQCRRLQTLQSVDGDPSLAQHKYAGGIRNRMDDELRQVQRLALGSVATEDQAAKNGERRQVPERVVREQGNQHIGLLELLGDVAGQLGQKRRIAGQFAQIEELAPRE